MVDYYSGSYRESINSKRNVHAVVTFLLLFIVIILFQEHIKFLAVSFLFVVNKYIIPIEQVSGRNFSLR